MKENTIFSLYVRHVGGRPEAARRLGISVGMVGHIETGIRGISPRIAMRIESDTDGLIQRSQLRPDLWGDKAHAAPETA